MAKAKHRHSQQFRRYKAEKRALSGLVPVENIVFEAARQGKTPDELRAERAREIEEYLKRREQLIEELRKERESKEKIETTERTATLILKDLRFISHVPAKDELEETYLRSVATELEIQFDELAGASGHREDPNWPFSPAPLRGLSGSELRPGGLALPGKEKES